MIKNVPRSAIESAIKEFDINYRDMPEWSDWDKSKAQYYGVEFNGRLYPPKKIISIATGMNVSEFSGGSEANNYLAARNFKVIEIQKTPTKPFVKFEVGKIYNRKTQITGIYGGSPQSGIAPSRVSDAIFLFTGTSGEQYGYIDRNDVDDSGECVFKYTGEGQVGNMEFSRGNLAIRDHSKDGRALHLFQSLGKGKGHKYLGEYVYAMHHVEQGLDKKENQRQIIIFHLVPVEKVLSIDGTTDAEMGIKTEPVGDLATARKRAIEAAGSSASQNNDSSIRTLYKRSKAVKDYVLLRANGICELCKAPAPFNRTDGTPYLEPHHTTRLSDGGPDHPRYVGALCPACHREIHHGLNGIEKNNKLMSYLLEIELEK